MTALIWGLKRLARQRLRTGLSLAGIAVAAAMLLDMVMLSGGIDKSFADLLLLRGYQLRLTPKGTLPFDTEATMAGASSLVAALRRDPAVEAAGAVLGTSLYGRTLDSTVTLVGYGIQPEAQSLYQVTAGRDLAPDDTQYLEAFGDELDLLAIEGEDLQFVEAGGQGVGHVGEDLAEAAGGFTEQALTQGQGDTTQFAVQGLDAGGQSALVLGVMEVPVGRALATQKGVGDDMDELGEGEDVLVRTSSVAVEDVVEESILRAEFEETEDTIRQGQTLADFSLEGLHQAPSRKSRTTPGGNL